MTALQPLILAGHAARPERLAVQLRGLALPRRRRVLLLLTGMWLLHAFDLAFTLVANLLGNFVELNPIAAPLLAMPWYFLVTYKCVLLLIGTVLLTVTARHWVSELSTWFLFSVSLYVAVRWHVYYELLINQI